uniref:Uncharacterized protein n=1 Tax=Arundo donax TaxID=35708 RepID=A0A0A9CNP6_ARUDO
MSSLIAPKKMQRPMNLQEKLIIRRMRKIGWQAVLSLLTTTWEHPKVVVYHVMVIKMQVQQLIVKIKIFLLLLLLKM